MFCLHWGWNQEPSTSQQSPHQIEWPPPTCFYRNLFSLKNKLFRLKSPLFNNLFTEVWGHWGYFWYSRIKLCRVSKHIKVLICKLTDAVICLQANHALLLNSWTFPENKNSTFLFYCTFYIEKGTDKLLLSFFDKGWAAVERKQEVIKMTRGILMRMARSNHLNSIPLPDAEVLPMFDCCFSFHVCKWG